MSRSSLLDAWSRVSSEMLQRLPEMAADGRRVLEWSKAPHRLASEMHDAWLDTVGGVSKNRYLSVLEENLELRRRLEALERRSSTNHQSTDKGDESLTETMDGAFRQIRDAQEQWMSMWLPGTSSTGSTPASTHAAQGDHRDPEGGGNKT